MHQRANFWSGSRPGHCRHDPGSAPVVPHLARTDLPAACRDSTLTLRLSRVGSPADPRLLICQQLEETRVYPIADEYCDEALAIAGAAGDDYLVADLAHVRASVLLRQGHQDAALPLIDYGLDLARRLGEPHLTARLLSVRSYAVDVQGDRAGAAKDAAESLRLFRQLGDLRGIGTMVGSLGYLELSTGDLAAARSHLLESLDLFRDLNDGYGITRGTFNLGLCEYLADSLAAAESLFARSLDLATRARDTASSAYALIGLAMAGSGRADNGRSAQLHGAADRGLAVLGETLEPLEGRSRDRDCQRLRDAMAAAAFEAEYAAGQALTAEQILVLARRREG